MTQRKENVYFFLARVLFLFAACFFSFVVSMCDLLFIVCSTYMCEKSINESIFGFQVDLEHQREVSKHEGSALAQLWGCSFIETSAKNRTNVNDVFAEVVREMNSRPSKNKKSYCCSCTPSCCIL